MEDVTVCLPKTEACDLPLLRAGSPSPLRTLARGGAPTGARGSGCARASCGPSSGGPRQWSVGAGEGKEGSSWTAIKIWRLMVKYHLSGADPACGVAMKRNNDPFSELCTCRLIEVVCISESKKDIKRRETNRGGGNDCIAPCPQDHHLSIPSSSAPTPLTAVRVPNRWMSPVTTGPPRWTDPHPRGAEGDPFGSVHNGSDKDERIARRWEGGLTMGGGVRILSDILIRGPV